MLFWKPSLSVAWWFVFCIAAGCQCQGGDTLNPSRILVIGATGGTGLRAIQGLIDVGYIPRQIRLVTRDATKPNILELKFAGFDVIQANLEKPSSLKGVTTGCSGCYIHSTSSDLSALDTGEVDRARNLCDAIIEQGNIHHVVYNSAAAEENHGVLRIEQKHAVEEVFRKAASKANYVDKNKQNNVESKKVLSRDDNNNSWNINIENERQFFFTSLRANIFMEELWKKYTRPQILKGKYPLPVNFRRKIYLLSVRDLGRLAGRILATGNTSIDPSICRQLVTNKRNKKWRNSSDSEDVNNNSCLILNVAGDWLSGPQIAKAFANAQGTRCKYVNPRLFTLKAKMSFKELYEQIRFLKKSKEKTNIEGLKKEFPDLLTSFATFLEETNWGDRNRTYDDISNVSDLQILSD